MFHLQTVEKVCPNWCFIFRLLRKFVESHCHMLLCTHCLWQSAVDHALHLPLLTRRSWKCFDPLWYLQLLQRTAERGVELLLRWQREWSYPFWYLRPLQRMAKHSVELLFGWQREWSYPPWPLQPLQRTAERSGELLFGWQRQLSWAGTDLLKAENTSCCHDVRLEIW